MSNKNKNTDSPKPLWKDNLVICMLIATGLSNGAYSIIAPFLPPVFAKKEIGQDWVGFIFSIYSVAYIFCSFLVGTHLIPMYGRRKLI